MKDNIFYISATITSALTFIEGLVPILQVIMLIISLILSLIGLFNTIKDKLSKGEDISPDLKKGIDVVKDTSEKINEIKRGDENDRR